MKLNNNETNTELSNNNDNIENLIIKPKNKEFASYFKNYNLDDDDDNFKNEIDNYQKSFDDIISFSKSYTLKMKNDINCIIFHTENSDGIMSANIAVNYLISKNKEKIVIIPIKPASGSGHIDTRLSNHENRIKDKNVLILDLQYNKENLDFIKKYAKSVTIIDDHSVGNKSNKHHFIGSNHATVAYTWKFFYPNKEVPLYVMIIDNDDRKLQLKSLSKYRKISSFYNYRIFHNPYLKIKFDKVSHFKYLNKTISDEFKIISNIIGHYYEELANNMKDQIARNARKATFQGHPVYVLNYNDPVLHRMVGRQMITNAQKNGDKIDFAVLWGYEYTYQYYKVELIEYHGGKPKHNLPKMAKTLGNIGKTKKGGGGANFVGNFYWPRSKDKDIWDLFTKKFI